MKILLVVLSLLVLATASYAVNVGDIVGGYPAGYNPNNTKHYRDSVGKPITPTFTSTATAGSPAIGTMKGPLPAGFGFKPGTSTPNDNFLNGIGRKKASESDRNPSFIRVGGTLSNIIRTAPSALESNLQVVVAGSNSHSANNLGYYIGYKVLSVAW